MHETVDSIQLFNIKTIMRAVMSFRRPDRDKAEPDACGLLALSRPEVPEEKRYATGAEQA